MGTTNTLPRKGGGGNPGKNSDIPEGTPDGTIFRVINGAFQSSGLSETDSKIISVKTIQTPPGSLELGADLHISSANHGVSIQNKAITGYGLMTLQVWDKESGTVRPRSYNGQPKTTVIKQEIMSDLYKSDHNEDGYGVSY